MDLPLNAQNILEHQFFSTIKVYSKVVQNPKLSNHRTVAYLSNILRLTGRADFGCSQLILLWFDKCSSVKNVHFGFCDQLVLLFLVFNFRGF